ncbi:ATP-dependent Clp protease proteolytic subunit [Candidatus Dojkabacteria bacterium]|nr:ATP-dependent Clp protease proteolytic subunit [Candidatus Dojkabacteria bacterium]
MIPTVLERSKTGEVSYDLYSRLLKDRIVFVHGEINMEMANIVVAQLLYLQKQAPKEDISMYINSVGGGIYAGLAILDTMNHISCDVSTIVVGQALSMGSVLLAAGKKGKRYALPNSTIMIHQPMITLKSTLQAADIEIEAKEVNRLKDILAKMLADYTSQSKETVKKDMDRDNWMDTQIALKYGIIDKILK